MDILDEFPEDWRKPVKAWLSMLASSTQRSYTCDLRHWLAYCRGTQIDPFGPHAYQVIQYVADLRARYKPATTARRTNALSSLFAFLGMCGLYPENPFLGRSRRTVNRHHTTTRYLSLRDALGVIEAAKAWNVPMRTRNIAIVTLMLMLGIRVGEVVGLRTDQVTTLGEHRALPIRGKGGVTVDRALPEPVETAINAYLAQFPHEGPLFATASGAPLDPATIFRLVQELARIAGIDDPDRITPHALRHTFATIAAERGATLEAVQAVMGHADPTTTRRYQHRDGQLGADPAHLLAQALG